MVDLLDFEGRLTGIVGFFTPVMLEDNFPHSGKKVIQDGHCLLGANFMGKNRIVSDIDVQEGDGLEFVHEGSCFRIS